MSPTLRRVVARALLGLGALAAAGCHMKSASAPSEIDASDVRVSGMGVNIELADSETTRKNLEAIASAIAGLVPPSLKSADFAFLDVSSVKQRRLLGWIHAVSETQTERTIAKIALDAALVRPKGVETHAGETYVVTPTMRENPYVQWSSGRLVEVTLKDSGNGAVQKQVTEAANRLKSLPLLTDLRKLGFLVGDVRLSERSLRAFVLCHAPADCMKHVEDLPHLRAYVREARFFNDTDEAPTQEPLASATPP